MHELQAAFREQLFVVFLRADKLVRLSQEYCMMITHFVLKCQSIPKQLHLVKENYSLDGKIFIFSHLVQASAV